MLIGTLAVLSLLPVIAIAMLLNNIDSKKLRLILLGLTIGMVALIILLWKLYVKFDEQPEAIHSGWPLFGGILLFGGYIMFIVVVSLILNSTVRTNRMAEFPSESSKDQTTQIVPKGYWLFWFVVWLLGCIGALAMTVYSVLRGGPVADIILGVGSLVYCAAWAAVYWRIKYNRSSA